MLQSSKASMYHPHTEKENNMADMMNPSTRSAYSDFSAANTADFKGGVAPASAPVAQPFDGVKGSVMGGEVVEGVYVQPEAGRQH
jgi:hypothetical protein